MLCQLIMRKGQAELTRQLCQILAICLITAQEQSRSSLSTAFSVCVAWSLCPWSLRTHWSVVCSTDWWNTPPISGVFSHCHMMSWQMRTHQSVQGWASWHSQFGTCQCLGSGDLSRFSPRLTRFFQGKHLIRFLYYKMQDFWNFVLLKCFLIFDAE